MEKRRREASLAPPLVAVREERRWQPCPRSRARRAGLHPASARA